MSRQGRDPPGQLGRPKERALGSLGLFPLDASGLWGTDSGAYSIRCAFTGAKKLTYVNCVNEWLSTRRATRRVFGRGRRQTYEVDGAANGKRLPRSGARRCRLLVRLDYRT